jgi:hypothetical protein
MTDEGDGRDGAGRARAPKVVTTTEFGVRMTRTFFLMFAVLIPFALIGRSGSTPLLAWIALLVYFVVLWIRFWVRWGRHWHPIRQFRYEWRGYRQGTFQRSRQSEAAFRRAWEESGGQPSSVPPPSGETPK